MDKAELEKLLDEFSIDCPDCDNSGTRVGGNEITGPEPEQCQWCYEYPRSRFRLNSAFTEIAREQRDDDCNAQCLGCYEGERDYEWDTAAVERMRKRSLVTEKK